MSMDIETAVEAQRLNDRLVVDGPREEHFIAGSGHHFPVEKVMVGLILAEQHQLDAAPFLRERTHDVENGVLRLGAGDHGDEPAWFQSERSEVRDIRARDLIGAVGDHRDLAAADPRRQMIGDGRVIGHQVGADQAACSLVEPQPCALVPLPLVALPLDAVHINEVADAPEPVRRAEQRRVVAERQQQTLIGAHHVPHRAPVEDHRPRGALAPDRDRDPANAVPAVGVHRPLAPFVLAIDRDVPVALDQIQSEMLSEGLEPPVTGWNTANAHNADLFIHA